MIFPRARTLAAVALAAGLAALAGAAQGGSFGSPLSLPSAETPNVSGSIRLPVGFTSPPAVKDVRTAEELQSLWQRAGAAYGIPWQVLAAINKIESNFGRNMGPSSAGAVGWMQFMPETWLRWGLDANADGVADPWNAEDAIFAASRYLAASDGANDIRRAVFSYNHADWYVNQVLDLAQTFGAAGADATFQADSSYASIDAAQRSLVVTNRKLVRALAVERRLGRAYARVLGRVSAAKVFSERLTLQKQATLAGVAHDRAVAEVERLSGELDTREQELETARHAVATGGPTNAVYGTPVSGDGYVFPVGGGPSVVSVGHTHHDYPAADIAAPMGSPVYALADAIVEQAWHTPSGNCGIGLTLQASDGQRWTYCHLAYEEPAIQTGTAVAAGTLVGLVGSTGHSTGPHLHLQLQPASAYPQGQPWFESFAGRAFRWQDAPTPELDGPAPARLGDVFAATERPQAGSGEGVIAFTR
ncbi:MAG: lytic murein transglycosylase [Actinomycetota bacterium]|nr:lytic murein transglycosylase [Actinomycetota bacterium]